MADWARTDGRPPGDEPPRRSELHRRWSEFSEGGVRLEAVARGDEGDPVAGGSSALEPRIRSTAARHDFPLERAEALAAGRISPPYAGPDTRVDGLLGSCSETDRDPW